MFLMALKPHDHDGKSYKPGDTYCLNDYYAKQLIHLGFCREVEPGTNAIPPVEDDPIMEVSPTVEIRKSKRKYTRRDMVPVK